MLCKNVEKQKLPSHVATSVLIFQILSLEIKLLNFINISDFYMEKLYVKTKNLFANISRERKTRDALLWRVTILTIGTRPEQTFH